MAGERIGKLYEALVFVSLQKALSKTSSLSPVTWNPPSSNLLVQPDVCVGDLSAPEAIFLITRSGARRGWDKKFWRNVGEIVDIRSHYPATRLINISLGTEIKEELMEVLGLLVDSNLFPDRLVREYIEAWVRSIEAGSPNQQESIAGYIETKLKEAPSTIRQFVQDIGVSVTKSKAARMPWAVASAWLANRRGSAAAAAASWNPPSSIRRGLAKLLIFGDPKAVLGDINAKLNLAPSLGESFARFGWASKSITGWRVSDPELVSLLKSFDRPFIIRLLSRSTSDELNTICADVASENWLVATSNFIVANRANLKNARWLSQQLTIAQKDSTIGGLIQGTPPNGLKGNWLYRVLVAFIKLASGLKQGYGYEQFVGDVRDIANDKGITKSIIEVGGSVDQIRRAGSTDSLRRKLVDWVSGLRNVSLSEWQILLIGSVLTQRLSQIPDTKFGVVCKDLPAFMRRLTYEDRVAPYRFFEPLRAMIELALENRSIPYEFHPRFETLVSEASSSARGPGTTPIIRVGSSVIHWKSAHGSHTSDKTKELCGRGFCLRHRLSSTSSAPEHIRTVKKLILVLDGDFTAKDVEHLATAGWDNVFRPDQMDDLITMLR